MNSAVIKNNHSSSLGVGGVLIRPGASATVPNWRRVKASNAVRVWLDNGLIVEESRSDTAPAVAVPSLPGLSPVTSTGLPGLSPVTSTGLPGLSPVQTDTDDEGDEKQKIIDELASLGIEKTKRTSLENLRKELEAAKGSGA